MRRSWSHVAWVVLGAAAVGFGAASLIGRSFSLDSKSLTLNDFTQDYVSARAWRDGLDPYGDTRVLLDRYVGPDAAFFEGQDDRRNPHPPSLVLLHVPISFLDYESARAVWVWAVGASLVIAIFLVARALGLNRSSAFAIGCGFLALPVAQKLLQLIQFEGFLALLLVVGWRSLRGRGGDALAGAVLGFATALKLFPAFMAIALLRERRRRAVGWLAGTAATFILVSVVLLGGEETQSYLDASGDNYRFWAAAPLNISLVALPHRWLRPTPWFPDRIDLGLLAWVVAIGAAGFCIWGAARSPARMTGDVYWAAVPWMVLVSPLSWEYSLALMLPVVALVLLRSVARRTVVRLPVFVLLTLLVVGLPPGASTGPPGHVSIAETLPYLVPTLALLGFCIAQRKAPWDAAFEDAPAAGSDRFASPLRRDAIR